MYRSFCIALIFASGALAAVPALAGLIEGRVIEISDGATLTVLAREGSSLHRVRLAGIAAPKPEDVIGSRSRESLRRLVRGKAVQVDAGAIDSAGMLLGTVSILEGEAGCARPPCPATLDPGESQLSLGYAVVDKESIGLHSEAAQKRYAKAEADARSHRRGIWHTKRPVIRAPTNYDENAGVYPLHRPEPLTGKR